MTSLLMALGMDGEEILSTFYNKIAYKRAGDQLARSLSTPSASRASRPSTT